MRFPLLALGAALLAAGLVFFFDDDGSKANIDVVFPSPVMEAELAKFRDLMGEDFEGYRGHVHRCLSYTLHFIKGDEQALKARKAIELAFVRS
jgi:hypothetical protein